MPLQIGFSYAPPEGKYLRYGQAVREAAARLGLEIEAFDLWENAAAAQTIDGIVFTGGGDIAPERFGKGDQIGLCKDVNPERDDHEFGVWETARGRRLPVLGICRGAQLTNVAYGGDLLTQIPAPRAHARTTAGEDARHAVVTQPGTLIARLAAAEDAEVNSSHHQAVDKLAKPFAITARADDGTVEAFEWADPAGKPFLLAVQWHPERMNQAEPLAGLVFDHFLIAANTNAEKR